MFSTSVFGNTCVQVQKRQKISNKQTEIVIPVLGYKGFVEIMDKQAK